MSRPEKPATLREALFAIALIVAIASFYGYALAGPTGIWMALTFVGGLLGAMFIGAKP